MKKVLVFLADGFEDIEAFTVVDLLRRAKIEIDLVSIKDITVKSGSGINILLNKLIEEVNVKDYDLVFLPGGGGVKALDESILLKEIVVEFNIQDKYIAAICAAPLILGKLGILDNIEFTCFPSFEQFAPKGKYKKIGVVQSGNIITGRGIGYVNDFALHLIKILKSKEVRDNIAKQTLIIEHIK
ncbi:MAG: Chaperone protein YajL [Candidatus Izimaplasma bacterium HR2]|nr:MAG: Chaperone protein YajL [Candidatus Izimaplasma bacterium HR2]